MDIVHTFEEVYKGESDSIFRFCLVRVSNREQALDITQETFLRLWRNLIDNKEIRNNRAFLFKIANNLIVDWYRKKKSLSLEGIMFKDNEQKFDFPDNSIESNTLLKVEGKYVLEKISELPPTYQYPVYLRFIEELSPPEIGEILNISANAASVRVNRGLVELRKKIGFNN